MTGTDTVAVRRRVRGLAVTGSIATLAAVAATAVTALAGLHLVPAVVMIPSLARSLHRRSG